MAVTPRSPRSRPFAVERRLLLFAKSLEIELEVSCHTEGPGCCWQSAVGPAVAHASPKLACDLRADRFDQKRRSRTLGGDDGTQRPDEYRRALADGIYTPTRPCRPRSSQRERCRDGRQPWIETTRARSAADATCSGHPRQLCLLDVPFCGERTSGWYLLEMMTLAVSHLGEVPPTRRGFIRTRA